MSPHSRAAGVVLAAGKSTRMKTALPKVMHRLAGRMMIEHVLANLSPLKCDPVVVVIGPSMEDLAAAVAPNPTVVQERQLGTGHAVLAAKPILGEFAGDVLVVFGDCPFISPDTISRMLTRRRAADEPAVVVLGMRPADPAEYGRLMVDENGMLEAIVEHRDATPAQRSIALCNSGVMAIDGRRMFGLLQRVGNSNAKGEYYLTDIVGIARSDGANCAVVEAPADELIGINSRAELAAAEAILQDRLRAQVMAAGATLTDPKSVFLAADTKLGRDVVVGPNVVFGPGVTVDDGAEIKAFCHIEGSRIARGATVGPFARLRPGTAIGEKARIGNFVEAKNATLGPGAKANHLTYLGDASVGAGANIGAGTITANYDGFNKHRTDIGAEASIGSNSVLVAPVSIGRGAMVAAGSVITQNVSPDALALARGRQQEKQAWAAKFRESKGCPNKGTVVRQGNKSFRITITKSDGTVLPTTAAVAPALIMEPSEPANPPSGASEAPPARVVKSQPKSRKASKSAGKAPGTVGKAKRPKRNGKAKAAVKKAKQPRAKRRR